MKYYAVIDTNVIVSTFLKKGSVPEQITSYVWDGKIVPIVNNEILKEYREVLLRPKFHFNKDTVETFILLKLPTSKTTYKHRRIGRQET